MKTLKTLCLVLGVVLLALLPRIMSFDSIFYNVPDNEFDLNEAIYCIDAAYNECKSAQAGFDADSEARISRGVGYNYEDAYKKAFENLDRAELLLNAAECKGNVPDSIRDYFQAVYRYCIVSKELSLLYDFKHQ